MLKGAFRFLQILIVMLRFGLDQLIFPKFCCLSLLLPKFFFKKNKKSNAERLRLALESLGPTFVKFGQILSTRHDMLPEAFISELAKLQDKVKPFPADIAIKIVEADLGNDINKAFKSFTKQPLASASVAQVHTAVLHSGEKVVVKILRPNITKTIKHDIAMMRTFALMLASFSQGVDRLKIPDVINEFEHNILNELNLVREAGNASQIKRNYSNSKFLYVPTVYWDYCSKNVLVLERITGISIGDIAALKKAKVNMEKLAKIGIEIFFSQVFKDRFFHADMHPGNIFVDCNDPENPKYIAVDFGIVGALSELDQRYIAENFLAFFNRDYGKVAKLHVDSGWVPANIRVDQFEMDIRAVCEPVFARPLQEICFGKLLLNLFNTAKRYEMTVQPQLILLQKTLFAVEALGRRLYPQLNLWECAKPYLENWVKERVGVKGAFIKTREQIPFWLEKFPEAPNMLFDFLEQSMRKNEVASVPAEKTFGKKTILFSYLCGVATSVIIYLYI
jgi:ubiquinone biosynthesis protein